MKTVHFILFLLFLELQSQAQQDLWPQFRGLNGLGVASETANPPVSFGSDNLLWKLDLPPGASSPVIWKDKLLITGCILDTKELKTYCIDRMNGKVLWDRSVISDRIEKVHPISSPAQSSVATDGLNVIAFFGSSGLICYDMDGKEVWRYQVPFPNSYYGNAPSPVIIDDKLILSIDYGSDRFLVALNKSTGKEIWKTIFENPVLPNDGGSATPNFKNGIIVVHRCMEVAGYSAENGKKLWRFPILTSGNSSPIIDKNKAIVSCWFQLSEEDNRTDIPSFDSLLQKYDLDINKSLSYNEFPDGVLFSIRPEITNLEGTSHSLKEVFGWLDQNGDKEISQVEWDGTITWFKNTFYKTAGLIAINLDSAGELHDSALLWRITEDMPEVPTPICYMNRIYMVKNGGKVTCINPSSGNIYFKALLGNTGPYISSPIAANGMIYFFSYNGKLTILKASDQFEIVGQFDLKNKIVSTPAIIQNTMYIRTGNKLFAYEN